ncbi:MAG: hypothetical protein Q9193_004037, partial [Seirophora villosa]
MVHNGGFVVSARPRIYPGDEVCLILLHMQLLRFIPKTRFELSKNTMSLTALPNEILLQISLRRTIRRSLQRFCPFSCRRGLSSLATECYQRSFVSIRKLKAQYHRSTVEKITLFHSAVSAVNVRPFLTHLHILKCLHYSQRRSTLDARSPWDAGGFLKSITACAAGASLEELYLYAGKTASLTAFGSFRALERLKKLFTADVLITRMANEGQKSDSLPPEPEDPAPRPEQGFGVWGLMLTSLEELTVIFAKDSREMWRRPRPDRVFDAIGGVKEKLLARLRKVQ